jgi:DNA-binding transcriptional ArsR family regulator
MTGTTTRAVAACTPNASPPYTQRHERFRPVHDRLGRVDVTRPLALAQPTVSHHLKVLAAAGLVLGERRGNWMWYRVVPEA